MLLESPNATVEVFGDMAYGKAEGLAGMARTVKFFVTSMFEQYRFEFLCSVFSF